MLLLLLALLAGQATPLPRIVVETDAGTFEIEVDTVRAPATASNFLTYVDDGLYDGGRFYRTVTTSPDNQPKNEIKIDVIQAGANAARRRDLRQPIALERTSATGIRHTDGTVSMARTTPDTARDEFFICIGEQPSLDFGGGRQPDGQGFAAFGRVVSGMEVVRRIHSARADAQRLAPSIRILRMYRKGQAPAAAPEGW